MSDDNKKTSPALSPWFGINKKSSKPEVDQAVNEALKQQYERARIYQEANGRTFKLELNEFLALVTTSRRKKMADKMRTGNFERFMRSNSGYVLTWKSREAFFTGDMTKETAKYLNREDAKRAVQFGPGDKHSDESIELIRRARLGTKQKEQTKQAISKSMQGHDVSDDARANMSAAAKGKTKSENHKANMREAAKTRWAKVRADKEKNDGAQ